MSATGWADNADIALEYDLAQDTENYAVGGGKPVTTIYGSTPRYSNDAGDDEYRYDIFPNAVELCVPENTYDFSMVINAATYETPLSFGEGDNPPKVTDRKFIPSFAIMDEDGCLAAPASGEACSNVYTPSASKQAWQVGYRPPCQ